ncbi:MAG: HEAT repeat domain-containing protein [Gemmatimonadota bacterium]
MNEQNLVRAGQRRLALRGTLALMFGGGLLLLTTSGKATELFDSWRAPQVAEAQDSTQITQLLAKVRGLDPTICQLVRRSLDNRFGNWYGGGYLHDPAGVGAEELLADWNQRSAVVRPGVLPVLRRSLSDADACVRYTSAQLLGRAEVGDLSAELRSELGSTSAATREAALLALGYHDKPTGVDPARRALRDGDLSVRIAAAWALGSIEHRDAISALAEQAADPDVRMRRTVAWALGTIEDRSAIATLSRMLTDAEASVRIQAAHALGQIEDAEAIPALVRLLETDRDPKVRRAAASALGQISG